MKKYVKIILKWIPFVLAFVFYMVFYAKNIQCQLDSDISSELVLSRLLASEHKLITKNFFYSTEMNIINTHIAYTFLFLFTDSFYKVRVCSRILILAAVLGSFYYLCRQMKIQKYFPYLAIFFVLPFSLQYMEFCLIGDFYFTHIAISFLAVALTLHFEKAQGKVKWILLTLILLLAFFAGLPGPRYLFTTYFPLVIVALLRTYKKHQIKLIGAFYGLIASGVGYLVNTKILVKHYSFSNWNEMNFQNFSFTNCDRLINGILVCLGYREGEVFSSLLAGNVACFAIIAGVILYGLFIWRNGKNVAEEEKVVLLFTGFSLLVITALYLFTNTSYEVRYYLPTLVYAVVFLGCSLAHHNWNQKASMIVAVVVLLMMVASSLTVYKTTKENDKTADMRDVVNVLVENGYQSGYATFWKANVLTELSEGQVEMYAWKKAIEEIIDVDDLFTWLQVASHFENGPEGKVCIVLDYDEVGRCNFHMYEFDSRKIYENSSYVVYGFDSYEHLLACLSHRGLDIGNPDYIENGLADMGDWYMEEGSVTRGPHMTLYAGTYNLTVSGENLGQLGVTITSDFGENELFGECIAQDDNMAVFQVTVDENCHFCEFHLVNYGQDTAAIYSGDISRVMN